MASASAVECTATVAMPSSLQARSIRSAISPRLAIRILSNIGPAVRRHSMITSGSPNSTGWPSSNRICVTVPARGAGIWFMVFIASMISSVSPAFTLAADLDEWLGAGLGRAIGGADHRRDARRRDAWPDRAAPRSAAARGAAGDGAGARRRRSGRAAPRATRTRWPSCSISISVRPVSSSSLVSSRIRSRSTIGAFRSFCHAFRQRFALAPIMRGEPADRQRVALGRRSRRSRPWPLSRRRNCGGIFRARGYW